MRRLLATTLACAAALLTAGCSVPLGAVAGIGVDASGSPVGYLQVCQDHIDGATIYIDDAHTFGEWESSPTVTDFTTWSMADPSGTWKTTEPLGNLRPRTTYTLYGWTQDDSSSAAAVEFTVEDLADMVPGQVRYWSGRTSDDGMTGVYLVVSESEFREKACKQLGF